MKIDTKVCLSLLWIIVMFNMVFADVLSLYIPGSHEVVKEFAGDISIAYLMLAGAIIHQIPVFMILLSRVLKYSLNRRLNIGVAIFTIIYVVGWGSLFPHYIFLAGAEVLCLWAIIWISWKWKKQEGEV